MSIHILPVFTKNYLEYKSKVVQKMYQVRTDLALEAREKFESDNVEI